MIQGKYLNYKDDLSQVFYIRKQVFVVEQKVPEEEEYDEIDDLAVHVLVFESESSQRAVATGRVFFDGTDYRIGRVAVLKEFRGKNYGDFVVRMLANKAFLAGADIILIHAQIVAEQFYEKIGFSRYGTEFQDAGIPHIAMKLESDKLCKKCTNMANIY